MTEILTGFGSPYIIHFDVDIVKQKEILSELSSIFPAKILLGEQNDLFTADMKSEINILVQKLQKYNTLPWDIAIKLIQYEMNQSEIQNNITPYEALFGVKMNKNGRDFVSMPLDLVNKIFHSQNDEDDDNDS